MARAGRGRRWSRQGDHDDAPPMLLRPATIRDLAGLQRLARRLDTVNLPSDAVALRRMVRQSRRAFAGEARSRAEAVYLFVAEDRDRGRIAGASVIVAKHGTQDSPHYYLEVAEEERYSKTLDRLFHHTYLHLHRSFDGPTEVGGLIVHPGYRGHRASVGKQLSYVRFLYMGQHPTRFEPTVLAEMLPPLTPSGGSPLWECYGRRVTGLSFREADLLSRQDKEFIDALFPTAPIYVRMLPEDVRDQIGTVAPASAPALHVLEKIGFRFLRQIDPFDGGPYYGARLSEIALVRELRRRRVCVPRVGRSGTRPATGQAPVDLLIAAEDRTGFRAVRAAVAIGPRTVWLPAPVAAALAVRDGARVVTVPFL